MPAAAMGRKINLGPQAKPYLLKPGESLPDWGNSVKASADSTGGGFSLIESSTAGGAPWHVHTREDEAFYVIEGAIVVWCGSEIFHAGPGCFVFLPRGIPHAWDVESEGKARLLMITVPAMLEQFLKGFHAAVTDQRPAVAAKYGLTFFPGRPG
jgi:mannose-6-phosphate isomerase-like protein (cupin superfamily)